MKKVLNVGGNNKAIPLPSVYAGWDHVLLDIDPRGNPDVVCDARELTTQPAATYDSVYCSHNLEHYYHHDARKVLAGFRHVLRPEGFALVRVPDMMALFRTTLDKGLDIDDVLYQSPAGPITVRDFIYGLGGQIESSGNDFFAHKTGFSPKSLVAILRGCGFPFIYLGANNLEINAFAFSQMPGDEIVRQLGLPVQR